MFKKSLALLSAGLLLGSLTGCGELAPLLNEVLKEEGGSISTSGGMSSGSTSTSSSGTSTSSNTTVSNNVSLTTGGGNSTPAPQPTQPEPPAHEEVDVSAFINQASGEQVFQNLDKGAGTVIGDDGISALVVVSVIGGLRGDTVTGYMAMIEHSSGKRWEVVQSDGSGFVVQTEVLGGQPFVPLYVQGIEGPKVYFAHRLSAGTCNFYEANFDGSQYVMNSPNQKPCSY